MRIAVIADPINNQGAGVHSYTRHLVEGLIRNGGDHQIILVCEKKLPEYDVEQVVIPNTRLPIGWASLRLFFLVPLALIIKGVDVVIEPAHFGPFNLPSRIRRVTVIHDMTPLLFPEHHRWHSQWLQRVFLRRILSRTDLIVTNSENTRKDVNRFFPFTKDKTITSLLGKDPFFKPVPDPSNITALGLKPGQYFHYVGTIEPRKQLDILLDAFCIFRDRMKRTPIKLVIAGGKGWKTEAFDTAMKTHPYREDIFELGYVEKGLLPVLHSHSLSLIYPSKYEGFGLPILEALSCGCPVITARNSSLTEVGGELANYFETGNSEELTACMIDAIQRTEAEDYRAACIAWSNTFSWDQHARDVLGALAQLFKKEVDPKS